MPLPFLSHLSDAQIFPIVNIVLPAWYIENAHMTLLLIGYHSLCNLICLSTHLQVPPSIGPRLEPMESMSQ